MRWMGIAALAAAACGPSKETRPASSTPATVATRPATCAQRADALGTWAAAITVEGRASVLADGDQLIAFDGAPLPPADPESYVAVHRTRVDVDGTNPTSAEALAERLADDRQRDPDHVLLVAIDRDAGADQIVMAATGAKHGGFDRALFAFARRRTTSPPPRSSATDELDALLRGDPGDRVLRLGDLFDRTIRGCPALHQAFGQSLSAPDGGQTFAHLIGPALTECDCAIDLDAFRSVLWAVDGPSGGPPTGVIDVALAGPDDADAVAITGATWADMAPALIAAKGKRVRFVGH